MSDAEYREFLSFLFERYVRPRVARLRHRYARHMEDEFSYYFERCARSTQVLRFIESNCYDTEDIYTTFRIERLAGLVYGIRDTVDFSNRIADEGGFLDACQSHARQIADGLVLVHFPDADKDAMRETGSSNPDVELRSLAHTAKSWINEHEGRLQEFGFRQRLASVEEKLKGEGDEFAAIEKMETVQIPEKVRPRTKRWFKGLGQIGQGAALTIANVALAIGVLHIPVSPETQTWGAIASVATGIGTLLSGVGDLHNE